VSGHGLKEASREQYTWPMCQRDLALMSSMTLIEVGRMLPPLEGLVHPYDALSPLLLLVNPRKSPAERGAALAQLILLGKEAQ